MKKRIITIGAIFTSLLLLGTSCGISVRNNDGVDSQGTRLIRSGNAANPLPPMEGENLDGDNERVFEFLYSVENLKENYDDVIVIDARKQEDYLKGHLPNAINVHWTVWANMSVKQGEEGWSEILGAKELSEKFAYAGIDGKKTIVIYNSPLSGSGEEGRQLWILRMAGIENSYILNGGIEAWIAAGGATDTGGVEPSPVEPMELQISDLLTINTEELASKIGKTNILDARSDEEFAGIRNSGEGKNGRIPGAKHAWFKDFYLPDGSIQSPAQIRAKVESLGFATDSEIVVYCTGGIRSGFTTMILQMAGFNKARNYDNSFSEWANTNQIIDSKVLDELN